MKSLRSFRRKVLSIKASAELSCAKSTKYHRLFLECGHIVNQHKDRKMWSMRVTLVKKGYGPFFTCCKMCQSNEPPSLDITTKEYEVLPKDVRAKIDKQLDKMVK